VTASRPASSGMSLASGVAQPLWMRAAASIAALIAEGKLSDGARLPSERELCLQLDVSRVTLRKALQKLVADGMLTPSHGRGWFVGAERSPAGRSEWPTTLESFSETAARLGLDASSDVVRGEISPATIDEAEELGIAPSSAVLRLTRVRRLGGMAIALDESCLPAGLVPPPAEVDFSAASLYTLLERGGHHPAFAETIIEARAADAEFSEHLGVEVGSPVLALRQLVRTADGRALLSGVVRYAGDRYRLRTVFTRTPLAGFGD